MVPLLFLFSGFLGRGSPLAAPFSYWGAGPSRKPEGNEMERTRWGSLAIVFVSALIIPTAGQGALTYQFPREASMAVRPGIPVGLQRGTPPHRTTRVRPGEANG